MRFLDHKTLRHQTKYIKLNALILFINVFDKVWSIMISHTMNTFKILQLVLHKTKL